MLYLIKNRTGGETLTVLKSLKDVENYKNSFFSCQNIIINKLLFFKDNIYYTLHDDYIYNFYIVESGKVENYSKIINRIKVLNSNASYAFKLLIDEIENHEFIF